VSQPLLSIDSFSKAFGQVQVLKGISLDLCEGEVLGLLGENGAGKSTLMNLVSGRHRPTAGSMQLAGADFAPESVADGIAAGIRFVHQELSLAASLSVAENLFLGDYLSSPAGFIDQHAMVSRASGLLDKVGLSGIDPSTPVGRLRAGEQQLVEIAKAIVTRPRLLILDEPTSSLTPHESARLFSLVKKLAAEGTAVILITHRLEEALAQCSRIVVLRDGTLVSDRTACMTTKEDLIRDMVGRTSVFSWRGRSTATGSTPRVKVAGLTDGATLAPISLEVWPGEVVGLFGLLGAGRTEFLETLYGFRRAVRGTVAIDGVLIRSSSVAQAVAAGIALVPEGRKTRGILPSHSVRRNISLSSLNVLSPFGFMNTAVEIERTGGLARRLGLRMASAEQVIPTLSGGNQQKAILARALMSDPRVLLLDEPTHGVDVGAKSDIYDIIHNLAGDGLSILVASSELPEIMAIADRCAVFSAGNLVSVLDRAEMSEETILNLAFQCHSSPRSSQ
jgi:ribose transport system ATP-binding protein